MKSGLFIFALILSAAFVNAQDQKVSPVSMTAPPAAENKNAPEFKFEEEEYNFGTIKQGDSVTHVFTFTNTGKEPLIISSANPSCGCTTPHFSKEPIMKGGKGTVTVTFKSAGKMGMQDKTVTIQSNAKSGPKIIHMKGTVEAPKQADQVVPPAKDNRAAPLEIKSK